MTALSSSEIRRLAAHLVGLAYSDMPRTSIPKRAAVIAAYTAAVEGLDDADVATLNDAAALPLDQLSPRARRLVLGAVAMPAIARIHLSSPRDERRDDISTPPIPVLRAAARIATDPVTATDGDTEAIEAWVSTTHTKGTEPMADMTDYIIENRGLPADFDGAAQRDFLKAVQTELRRLGGSVREPFTAVVAGRLLLDGVVVPDRADFKWAVKRSYDVGVQETDDVANKTHYVHIVDDIRELRPKDPVRLQELASVADHVVAAGADWSIGDDRDRKAQVELGLLKYADGTADTGFAPLDLPAVVSEDASSQEIEPPNVRAVAMVAAAAEIEQTGAFDVVDRMVELFMEGMLPVRDDGGGRALDAYYWRSEDRLDAGARAAQYARVLGMGSAGGRDAQPNSGFDQFLLRFVGSLVKYDHDQQVSNLVTMGANERVSSSQRVRKAAHDLAANASLYGWGFTIFGARRLSRHIDLVFDVLGQESLQRAYGVTGPWQLVERVSAIEFGAAPAVVQHRTRAKSIKDLLDLLAAYSAHLSVSGSTRPFLPGAREIAVGESSAVVSYADYEAMIAAANSLLAVGGVSDSDVASFAQPVAAAPRSSIPTVNMGSQGSNGSQAMIDQVTQLVQQGQFDQLAKLMPSGNG